MKSKIIWLFILFCCLFNVFCIPIATAEIVQIQAVNDEYENTHLRPETSPRPLNSFMEMSTDGISLDMNTHSFDEQAVVYMEKNNDVYHMGGCSYYAEKSNGDYSRPCWLSDVVTERTRCTLCIPDELYYSYIHAVYISELNHRDDIIKDLLIGALVLTIMYIISLLLLLKKERSYRI